MPVIDPPAAQAALWFYALVLIGWLASATARGFVRLYTYWTLSHPETRGMPT
jgi:hypothetical protein